MPDSNITALTSISTSTDPANDPLVIVDVSDTSMAASGTTKKVTLNNLLACSPTATLASATITGDLTVATNGLKVDSANKNVGINTATPTNTAGYKTLEIVGTGVNTGGMLRFKSSDTSVNTLDFADSNGRAIFAISNHPVRFGCNDIEQYRINPLGVFTWYDGAGGTRMTLNSTGLGVGASPATGVKLDVNGFVRGTSGAVFQGANNITTGSGLELGYSGSYSFLQSFNRTGAAYLPIRLVGSSIDFDIANSVKMTLDASGNLLVGATAVYANEKIRSKTTTTNYWSINMESVNRGWLNRQSDSNGGIAAFFEVGAGTNVGSITTTSSGTSFVTTSDYRLKESVQPLVGGIARVSALKPSTYKWKADGSSGEGFLAHELAEVVPLAVTGEKDAVNEDGSIKAQGVDLSKVVPVLVAAIQELAAEVNALKNA